MNSVSIKILFICTVTKVKFSYDSGDNQTRLEGFFSNLKLESQIAVFSRIFRNLLSGLDGKWDVFESLPSIKEN